MRPSVQTAMLCFVFAASVEHENQVLGHFVLPAFLLLTRDGIFTMATLQELSVVEEYKIRARILVGKG